MLAENVPMALGVILTGIVVTGSSSKVTLISELGSKLIPIIFTGVPTGPEVSLSPITGFSGGGRRHCECCLI